ncbi:MAG TPA: hypothetical protein PLT48_17560, partial [Nitrospira sp.]|nr:hypothetical protein [Nitrospira sp.]
RRPEGTGKRSLPGVPWSGGLAIGSIPAELQQLSAALRARSSQFADIYIGNMADSAVNAVIRNRNRFP